MRANNCARVIGILLALALGACGGEPQQPAQDSGTPAPDSGPEVDGGLPVVDSGPPPTDAGAQPVALVRLVHAAPDVSTVDVYANGVIQASDVQYRTATRYVRLPAGTGVVSVTRADEPPANPIATTGERTFEEGTRYVAFLTDPSDGEPELRIVAEDDPPDTEPFAVRVVSATDDLAAIHVDLDADAAPEVEDLAPWAQSDWIAIEPFTLRPAMIGSDRSVELFTVGDVVGSWLSEADRALFVIVGRPASSLPSNVDGLSILVVLPPTESASPTFVLRPDPRLALLHAAPSLAPSEVIAAGPSGFEVPMASALAFGELTEAIVPPGTLSLRFTPEGEIFGPWLNVDIIAGQRYLAVVRPEPNEWDPDRVGITLIRDAVEENAFVVMNGSIDTPGAIRWFREAAAGEWLVVEGLDPMPYAERSVSRGVAIDPAVPLGIAREDRAVPNVFFEPPEGVGTRGFAVLAGSYFAAPDAPDAQVLFWIDAPPREPWSVVRAATRPGSGPLPDELPDDDPPDDPPEL